MSAQAVAERQDAPPATVEQHPASDSASLLQIISRAASDPAVDIDKMERLMQMHERLTERSARTAYFDALAAMQPGLPVIERKGMIRVPPKDGKTGHETPYALWEDINEAIRPLLAEHGFALSFRIKKDADRVEVTGVLSHREGHSEETTLSLPMDTTGSKNNVQAIGSSTSYGKRYTAMALLNITTRGEDDDGHAAEGPEVVSDEQRDALLKKLDATKSDVPKFCKFFGIEAIAGLPAKRFDEAMRMLDAKAK
jgi:hypothetical protein